MDLKTSKSPQEIGEYVAFGTGLSFATFKELSDYFMNDFPITKINEYFYAVVLLLTLAAGLKRVWGWFFKSNKTQSNGDD